MAEEDAYSKALGRIATDPFGKDITAESEKKSNIGTQKWADNRMAILRRVHADEQKELANHSKTILNYEKKRDDLIEKHHGEVLKLSIENDRKLWETKFQNAKTYSDKLGNIFSGLYELTGKHNKSLFLLTKAASLASIAMNTAQGIMAALAPGALGWPMAILIAAEGAVQMALASAQTLAGGGLVQGYSPTKTADNIPLAGTAGEFMQPVDSVDYYGTQVHEAMRQKLIPREIFSGLTLPGAPGPSGGNLQAGGLVGDAGKSEFTFVNLTDPRELDRYLATPAGKDAIINVLSSRSQTVRRLLR